MLFHPEMGEKGDTSKLFHASHNFRDTYSLVWLLSRDAEAKEFLKANRIRPTSKTTFQQSETGPGKSSYGMWPGEVVIHILITGNSYEKIMKSGNVAFEALLD